jgi:hypothetical protein
MRATDKLNNALSGGHSTEVTTHSGASQSRTVMGRTTSGTAMTTLRTGRRRSGAASGPAAPRHLRLAPGRVSDADQDLSAGEGNGPKRAGGRLLGAGHGPLSRQPVSAKADCQVRCPRGQRGVSGGSGGSRAVALSTRSPGHARALVSRRPRPVTKRARLGHPKRHQAQATRERARAGRTTPRPR